ncbi:hypothetical protein [Sinimarinibacterium sp. NLF-5-8]|uniref:hypothetical protein n=1 Tax=Sinimarinibacterium sp. NLF-5-8 TaxID=2698684 RepID=UPI00137BAB36|nr:hypothetical protein [Sinimarinibacterium sp. NLF-5-8]QHS09224.1 hypothetical protein GT972_03000 [Sinimarinibacterium sp. NLF-5-8]
MIRPLPLLAGVALLWAGGLSAQQSEMPAVGHALPSAGIHNSNVDGTTIIGEQESPIGLYITPWRDAQPEQGIDRPARLLQEQLLPIDQPVFVRQIEYHKTLSASLKARGKVTPQ